MVFLRPPINGAKPQHITMQAQKRANVSCLSPCGNNLIPGSSTRPASLAGHGAAHALARLKVPQPFGACFG
jgi:hypothetical protein